MGILSPDLLPGDSVTLADIPVLIWVSERIGDFSQKERSSSRHATISPLLLQLAHFLQRA